MVASRSRNQDPILVLVLSGIAIGSLLGAGISLLKILADPFTQLPSITFWLLGSFTAVGVKELTQLTPYFNTRHSATFLIALALKSARFRRR